MLKRLKCILLFTIFVIFSVFGLRVGASDLVRDISDGEGAELALSHHEKKEKFLVCSRDDIFYLYSYESNEQLYSSTSIEDILGYSSCAEYCLEGVVVNDRVVVPKGEYIISGSATFLKGFVVFAECDLTLSDVSLYLNGGSIDVMGGSLTVVGAYIHATDSAAIEVGYSYSSSLFIESGEIVGSIERPVVDIKMGRAVILGGSIKNDLDAAIYNLGSLFLSGNPEFTGLRYDIITEHPINLSYEDKPFLNKIKLQYNTEFERGSMKEILRSCNQKTASLVSVYDKNAREYELTFFEGYKGSLERNFAAVYLPFTVRIFDGEKLVGTNYYLKGEIPDNLVQEEKVGYVNRGFYFDEKFSQELSSDLPISTDLDLYVKYELSRPVFSLQSMTFTYDAAEHMLNFSTLHHPLEDKGIYRFEWFYNGESIGFIDGGISLINVSDSGRYYCNVTFLYGKDSVSVTTPEISVNILKKEVEIPSISSKKYNGSLQNPDIVGTSSYTIQSEGGINAGKYPVYLTLCDSENYAFSGTDKAFITLYFEIEKNENRFLEKLSISDTYANFPLSPSAYAQFGEVVFKYSVSIDGIYSSEPPSIPGEYYVIAEVSDTENYFGIISEPKSFNIIPERAISLSIFSLPDKCDYTAFESFSADGLILEMLYNSGRREIVEGGEVTVLYQSSENLRFGDNAVIAEYLGLSAVVPINVSRAEYDISALSFSSLSVSFDGEFHTPHLSGELPCGDDGIELCARIEGGGCDVGVYTVYLVFSSDSKNYIIPEPIEASLTVTPLELIVQWGECEFIYDGKSKLPSAYFLNELGVKIPLSPSGAVTNATENAAATVKEPSSNYRFLNPTVSFRVNKADFDLSGISWSEREIVYCGKPVTVTLTNLPEGLTVIGYTDNTATNVGNYIANALLSFDERNYNTPRIQSYEWFITPAEYDISGISLKDTEFIYDGNIHYPLLEGEMPIGFDGIHLEYSFSEGAYHASNETYEVRLIFKTESKNYKLPRELVAYVRILPKMISVIWEYKSAVYDGEIHIPAAFSDECEVVVSGGEIGAGRYTAYAYSASSDFEIINNSFEFDIKKAQNYFTALPAINDFYESQAPKPSGSAKEGAVIFEYFFDLECTRKAELPLSSGVYYMSAIAPETENYTEYISEPIRFEVIRVVPVGIEIKVIKNSFVAFERVLEGDFLLTAVYNDGSKSEISYTDVEIEYQSAESLRMGDDKFLVSWQDFSLSCEITVIKADYDLFGVEWENTEAVFDGELKHPTITGLPFGVTVVEYVGGGINVGEYTAGVILDYDTENYNPPKVDTCSFIIKPAVVNIPTLESAVYSGEPITVMASSPLYDIYVGEVINAGSYKVLLRLKDSKNYIFENSAKEVWLDFTVEKRKIKIKIEDLTLYLFERERMPEYTLLEDLFRDEPLDLFYEIDGESIYILTANPNFAVEAQGAKLVRSNRLSPLVREWAALILIVIIILLLFVVVFIKYKDLIIDKIARARCKNHIAKSEKERAEIIQQNNSARIDEDMKEENTTHLECESDFMTVNRERADSLISDSLAKSLLRREREIVYTSGNKRSVVNVDTLSESFEAGDVINVNDMKEQRIVSQDTLSVKVLARGRIDKPLSVKANAFSLSAVKMIALSGGEAIKVSTRHNKRWDEKNKDTIEKDTGV